MNLINYKLYFSGLYYRGVVKQINISDIVVTCIDYGFDITSRAVDLRKKIILTEIPALVLKCQLHGLSPSPTYLADNDIDYIYDPKCIDFTRSLLLNKKVHVDVQDFEEGCLKVKIKCDKVNVIEQLVDSDWAIQDEEATMSALSDSGGSVIIDSISMIGDEVEEVHGEKVVSYQLLSLPMNLKKMKIEVVSAGNDTLTWYIRLAGKVSIGCLFRFVIISIIQIFWVQY